MQDISKDISIIHFPSKTEPFVVIEKSRGLPSAPLSDSDTRNAFSIVAREIPCLLDVQGRKTVEHGLLHRIDTETHGLLLIASTQEFYDFILQEQTQGRFIKTYHAECEFVANNSQLLDGFPQSEVAVMASMDTSLFCQQAEVQLIAKHTFEIASYFRSFGKEQREVRPVTENSGRAALKKLTLKKQYKTNMKILGWRDNVFSIECSLKSGYRHQVRCHLAWQNLPIIGDPLYNYFDRSATSECKRHAMHFKACALDFYNPITEQRMHFEME